MRPGRDMPGSQHGELSPMFVAGPARWVSHGTATAFFQLRAPGELFWGFTVGQAARFIPFLRIYVKWRV